MPLHELAMAREDAISLGDVVGPIAILLQGQAWRWVWIPCFLSVLLLAPTVLKVWRDEKCGPICAMLLVLGWTFSVVDGVMCVALALLLWLVRGHINIRVAQYLRWAAAALGLVVLVWAVTSAWSMVSASPGESGREMVAITRLRNVMGLGVSAVMILWLLFRWIRAIHSVTVLASISMALALVSTMVLPRSLNENQRDGTAAKIREFADAVGDTNPDHAHSFTPGPSKTSRKRGRTYSIRESALTTSPPKKLRKRSPVLRPPSVQGKIPLLPGQVAKVGGNCFEAVDLSGKQVQFHVL